VLFAGALCLIKPGWVTDLVGVAILGGILVLQIGGRRRSAPAAA
jgi:UPF0716 family protein affecting phage T7 exclusion